MNNWFRIKNFWVIERDLMKIMKFDLFLRVYFCSILGFFFVVFMRSLKFLLRIVNLLVLWESEVFILVLEYIYKLIRGFIS